MKNKKDRFKQKGQSILSSGPNSMKDFLEGHKDAQIHRNATVQLHKTTEPQKQNCANTQDAFAQKHKCSFAQNRNYTNTQNPKELKRDTVPEELERIHVQIRKDLADKLMEIVYARKRAGKSKRKASQRHIIEEALEEYFTK